MITNFWNWLMASVTNAVTILQRMVDNTYLSPFFNLFLVIIGTMVVVKFVLKPIFGGSGSDKAKKKDEEDEK